ncbi:TVP38/TMEM64 family protein [Paraburkholderia sediminicola]|uniref:TVP38/TMEM64 family protein n=1 Tax=Paraburkholderia sediminicola TaxID=458836 RepID=UPI0038B99894
MSATLVEGTISAVEWGGGVGWLGLGIFALVFVVGTMVLVPASLLAAIAGFKFGPVSGMLLALSLGIVSALLVFLIGRSMTRPRILRWLKSRQRLAAVDATIGQRAFLFILLLRLTSVIPLTPLSYVLGAGRVRLRDFVLGSWLGLLPGTFLYVYLGSLVPGIREIMGGTHASTVLDWGNLYWLGLAAVMLAFFLVARIARDAVNRAVKMET